MKSKSNRGRPKLDETKYKGQIIQVRINPHEAKAIHIYCEENNYSISKLLRYGINEVLKKNNNKIKET